MNAAKHRQLNFAIGAFNGFLRCLQESYVPGSPDPCIEDLIAQMFASGLGAMSTARLPDIIDPPTSPSHRDVGHGVIPVGVFTVGAYYAAQRAEHPLARRFLEGAALGPAGHLVGDAGTSAGVNLVERGF